MARAPGSHHLDVGEGRRGSAQASQHGAAILRAAHSNPLPQKLIDFMPDEFIGKLRLPTYCLRSPNSSHSSPMLAKPFADNGSGASRRDMFGTLSTSLPRNKSAGKS